jgi:hypothetical protein
MQRAVILDAVRYGRENWFLTPRENQETRRVGDSALKGTFGPQERRMMNFVIFNRLTFMVSPGERSQYSDWLRAGRLRNRSSSPTRGKILLLSMSSRPALGPTQPPIQQVPGVLSPGIKWPGCEADHTSN